MLYGAEGRSRVFAIMRPLLSMTAGRLIEVRAVVEKILPEDDIISDYEKALGSR